MYEVPDGLVLWGDPEAHDWETGNAFLYRFLPGRAVVAAFSEKKPPSDFSWNTAASIDVGFDDFSLDKVEGPIPYKVNWTLRQYAFTQSNPRDLEKLGIVVRKMKPIMDWLESEQMRKQLGDKRRAILLENRAEKERKRMEQAVELAQDPAFSLTEANMIVHKIRRWVQSKGAVTVRFVWRRGTASAGETATLYVETDRAGRMRFRWGDWFKKCVAQRKVVDSLQNSFSAALTVGGWNEDERKQWWVPVAGGMHGLQEAVQELRESG